MYIHSHAHKPFKPDTLRSSHAVATPHALRPHTCPSLSPLNKHKSQSATSLLLCEAQNTEHTNGSAVCAVQDGVLRGPEMGK